MKHLLKAATAAGILTVSALQAQADTVLIANEPGPNRGARAHALEFLAEQIKERTNGSVTVDQLKEIAEIKKADLNAHDVDQAIKIIAGTARSMGIEVAE